MAQYVGLWEGGDNYSSGDWATDAEVFESLDHACGVMADRYRLGYVLSPARVPFVAEWDNIGNDGRDYARAGNRAHNLIAPCVAANSTMLLAPLASAALDALEIDGAYACSHLLTIGPRGGINVERLH